VPVAVAVADRSRVRAQADVRVALGGDLGASSIESEETELLLLAAVFLDEETL